MATHRDDGALWADVLYSPSGRVKSVVHQWTNVPNAPGLGRWRINFELSADNLEELDALVGYRLRGIKRLSNSYTNSASDLLIECLLEVLVKVSLVRVLRTNNAVLSYDSKRTHGPFRPEVSSGWIRFVSL